jgi:hypothetical protein
VEELNELVAASGGKTLAELPAVNMDLFSGMSAGGGFLPRLTLEGSNSNRVKDDLIAKGHYSLTTGKDEFIDLGESIDCLVLNVRLKALDMQDKSNVLWSYNPNSETYKAIQAAAESKDKEEKKSRLYGLEFLLYLPDVENPGHRYCTLFMGNASARMEAPKFRSVMRKAATLKWAKVVKDEYRWEVIKVFPSQRKIEIEDFDEMTSIVNDFLNPSEMTEKAPEEPTDTNVTRG